MLASVRESEDPRRDATSGNQLRFRPRVTPRGEREGRRNKM